MKTKITVDQLREMVGKEMGVSGWQLVDQARINAFADATGDHGDIHTRPDSAAAQNFGGTIAHGFLTLALLPAMIQGFLPGVDGYIGVNSGLERVRFVSPVPAGARVRGRFGLDGLETTANGSLALWLSVKVEVEGKRKARPALAAIWLNRFIPYKVN
jgi:acyl dehydratase